MPKTDRLRYTGHPIAKRCGSRALALENRSSGSLSARALDTPLEARLKLAGSGVLMRGPYPVGMSQADSAERLHRRRIRSEGSFHDGDQGETCSHHRAHKWMTFTTTRSGLRRMHLIDTYSLSLVYD